MSLGSWTYLVDLYAEAPVYETSTLPRRAHSLEKLKPALQARGLRPLNEYVPMRWDRGDFAAGISFQGDLSASRFHELRTAQRLLAFSGELFLWTMGYEAEPIRDNLPCLRFDGPCRYSNTFADEDRIMIWAFVHAKDPSNSSTWEERREAVTKAFRIT